MVRNEGATPGAILSATPGATPRQRPVNGGATHTPYTPSVALAFGGRVHATEIAVDQQNPIPAKTLSPKRRKPSFSENSALIDASKSDATIMKKNSLETDQLSSVDAPQRIDFDPQDGKGALKSLGGSQSDHWNNTLAEQAVSSLALNQSSDEQVNHQVAATVAALTGIAPKDELEGMMAAQLIAAHSATMDCYRRAMHGDQSLEARRENLNQATKLSRTWTTLLDALNKHRGKGQQKVTVEHVNVHAGGQAVVGTIEHPRGGDQRKSKD